jgi:hypothetical protein
MVQVAIAKIINMTFMLDGDMTALWTVLMTLVWVNFWNCHVKD